MPKLKRPTLWCALLLIAIPWAHADVSPPRLDTAVPPSTTNAVSGTQIDLADQGLKFTLFIPAAWKNRGSATLCVHFHTVAATAIHEHTRRNAAEPLAVFAIGTGANAYRIPFEDTNRMARVIALVETELRKHDGASNAHVEKLELSSFSAGYGAVRELVKSPRYFPMIQTVVLLDSLYGSLANEPAGSTNRVPAAEHIDVWEPLARAAMRGEKTFVITTSQVPTPTYASTLECAEALLGRVGLKLNPPNHNEPEQGASMVNLRAKADSGNFHVWSYSGTNAAAHMAHVRHMAEVWERIMELKQ